MRVWKRRTKRSIIRQMMVFIVGFFAVLLCVYLIAFGMISDAYRSDILRTSQAQITSELDHIEEQLSQIYAILYSAQNQTSVKRLLEDRTLNNALTVSLLRDDIRGYFDGLQLNVWAGAVRDIYIVHGDIRLPNIFGLCMYSEEWQTGNMSAFLDTLTPCGKGLYMYLQQEDGEPVLRLFAPVRSRYLNRIIGAIQASIELAPMFSQTFGEKYPTAVCDASGTQVWCNALWSENAGMECNAEAGLLPFTGNLMVEESSDLLGLQVRRQVEVDVFLEQKDFMMMTIVGLLMLLTLVLVVVMRIYLPFARQLRELLQGIANVRGGTLGARVRISGENELTALAETLNAALDDIEKLMQRIVAADDAEKRAVYKSLSNQIRPHFLNNALDKVRMTLRAQPEGRESARALERIMRYISYNLGKQTATVALDEELKNVVDYLEIYQMAYDNPIQVDMVAHGRLRGNLHRYELPKFTLLPLVENCIHHGFVDDGTLHRLFVTLDDDNDMMRVQVEDNGVGMDEERVTVLRRAIDSLDSDEGNEHGHGIGLPMVRERLMLFYGMDIPLTIESCPNVGTLVTISVPFTEKGATRI